MPPTVPLDGPWTWLGSRITSGATQLTGFRPFPGKEVLGFGSPPFEVVIGREVIRVDSGGGTAASPWAITRAQRGTTASEHLKNAQVKKVTFGIKVTSGGTVWDYTARWGGPRGVQITTSCPGGPERAQWTVRDRNPLTAIPDPRGVVQIFDSIGPFWIGLIDQDDPKFDVYGADVTIVARGYSIRTTDEAYTTSKIIDAFTPVYSVLETVRGDKLNGIFAGDYRGGGRSIISRFGDLVGKKPQEIFNQACAYGDLDDVPVYWFIRGHSDAPLTPYLDVWNRRQCEVDFYQVPLESLTPPSISWVASQVTNQVIIEYARGVTSVNNNAGITQLGGFIRSRFLQLKNDVDAIGDADRIGRAITETYGTIQPSASGIQIAYPHHVLDRLGNPVSLLRVEAGHPLVLTGVLTGNVKLALASFFIKGTSWDGDGRMLSLQTDLAREIVDDFSHYYREAQKAFDSSVRADNTGTGGGKGVAASTSGQRTIPQPTAQGTKSAAAPTDQSGRLGWPSMPDGADSLSISIDFGSAITVLQEAMFGEIQAKFPFQLLTANILLDAPGAVEIMVEMLDFNNGILTETPLFKVSTGGDIYGETVEMLPPFDGDPLSKLFIPEQQWLRGIITSTDGVAMHATLTIHIHRLPGRSETPNIPAPVYESVTSSYIGNGVGRISVEFDEPCYIGELAYGTNPEELDSGDPPATDYKLHWDILVDGLEEGQTYYFRLVGYNYNLVGAVRDGVIINT